MSPPQLQVCDFKLTQACRERAAVTDARLGYLTTVGKEVKFACDDCASEITERIAKDLKRKIRARGDRVA